MVSLVVLAVIVGLVRLRARPAHPQLAGHRHDPAAVAADHREPVALVLNLIGADGATKWLPYAAGLNAVADEGSDDPDGSVARAA